MPQAQLQCFCGEIIGLGPPNNSPGSHRPLPPNAPAAATGGLSLASATPAVNRTGPPCGADAHAGNGDKEIAP